MVTINIYSIHEVFKPLIKKLEMAGQDTVLPIISWLSVEIASGYRFVFIVLYQSNIFCILRSLPHRQPKTRNIENEKYY